MDSERGKYKLELNNEEWFFRCQKIQFATQDPKV